MPGWLAGGNLAADFMGVNCADTQLLHGRLVGI